MQKNLLLTQLVMTHQLVLYVRSPLLWLFEAQDNEVIDKLLDHLTFSSKKGAMRQLLLTACFWATVWLIPAVHGRLSLDTPTRALLGP